jgi:PTS system nitrogen regulatory IIA component
MGEEVMDLSELSRFLQRDARDLQKWASRGYLPAQRVGGEWRFHRAEITHWLETQMHAYTEQELAALERSGDGPHKEATLLGSLLSVETIAVPLLGSSKSSVLRALVDLAEQSGELYDGDALLDAIQTREEMSSTTLPSGVAIPHPRRPLPYAVGETIVAFGKTSTPIPFGGPSGVLTDLFFLVCSKDEGTHLKVLARLSRLFLQPDFLDDLREAESPAEAFQIIKNAEHDLIG